MRLFLIPTLGLFAALCACERDDYDVTPRTDPPVVDGDPDRVRIDPTRDPANRPGEVPRTGEGAERPRDSNSMDQELAQRVREAIQKDETLGARVTSLQVVANNGTVTLRGTVNSQADKDSIGTKVKAIPGVTNLENELTVTG